MSTSEEKSPPLYVRRLFLSLKRLTPAPRSASRTLRPPPLSLTPHADPNQTPRPRCTRPAWPAFPAWSMWPSIFTGCVGWAAGGVGARPEDVVRRLALNPRARLLETQTTASLSLSCPPRRTGPPAAGRGRAMVRLRRHAAAEVSLCARIPSFMGRWVVAVVRSCPPSHPPSLAPTTRAQPHRLFSLLATSPSAFCTTWLPPPLHRPRPGPSPSTSGPSPPTSWSAGPARTRPKRPSSTT